jgi:hypothetical protein
MLIASTRVVGRAPEGRLTVIRADAQETHLAANRQQTRRQTAMDQRMFDAYMAAKEIIDEQTTEEDAELLARVRSFDVLIVKGCYDRVEDVMRIMGVPHEVIEPGVLDRLKLAPEQTLIVNCPGHLGQRGITSVRSFVEQGGTLFTTDWALRHVIEHAFPGYLAYNQRPTRDEVVRIEIRDTQSELLNGVFHEGDDPLWWLEGSSYPIRIIDREKVSVLLTSTELEERYGEAPVAVTFNHGKGEVFHMISHYYLQRAETRTSRHESNWQEYAEEAGSPDIARALMPQYDYLVTAEVEAAHKSARLVRNLITDKQRKNRDSKE